MIDRRRLLATAALALCAALAGCGSDDGPERVESVPALGFVERFAPVFHLHASEASHPMDARAFVENSWLMWSDGDVFQQVRLASGAKRQRHDKDDLPLLRVGMVGEDPGYVRTPAHRRPNCPRCGEVTYATTQHTRPYDPARPPELRLRPGEGYYLDLHVNSLRKRRDMEIDGSQTVIEAPVYTEVVEEPADRPRGLRVTYWLLFGVNEPTEPGLDYYQGDWTRVSVFLRRVDGGSRYEPETVRYYQYDGFVDVPWQYGRVISRSGERGASHPEVFLSLGDHTPYPEPFRGRKRFVGFDGRAFTLPQEAKGCERCPELRSWKTLVNADTEPWYGFGGAWGAIGTEEGNTGSAGPSVWTGEPKRPSGGASG